MKRLNLLSVTACLVIACAAASCSKKSSSTTVTPTPTNSSTPSPSMGDVDGGFVSLQTTITTVTAGFPVSITSEGAVASFFASTGNNSSFVDGGTVSVNTYALDKQSNNSYLKTASVGMTPSTLNLSSNSSNWSIGGAGSIAAFTYNDNATFPAFTGAVPDSIVRSSGVTVSLGSNVTNADSVILFISAGSNSITRTFAGNAASASIAASDLSVFSAVSDKSAVMEVVPYRITVKAEGGKQYAFIKELASVKNINIQ